MSEYTYDIDKYTIGVDENGEDGIGMTVAKIENGELHFLGNCYGENARCIDLLIKENQSLKKENKILKDNWNKLKEYCKENTLCYEVGDDENTKLIGSKIHGLNVLDKMQEMEKNYGNVEDNT